LSTWGIRNGHERAGEIPARDCRDDGEEEMETRLTMKGMGNADGSLMPTEGMKGKVEAREKSRCPG
jgi:hypothetical protein